MKIGTCIEFAFKSFEKHVSKDISMFLKEFFDFVRKRVFLPKYIHTHNAYIDLAVVLSIHFAMNVDVQ